MGNKSSGNYRLRSYGLDESWSSRAIQWRSGSDENFLLADDLEGDEGEVTSEFDTSERSVVERDSELAGSSGGEAAAADSTQLTSASLEDSWSPRGIEQPTGSDGNLLTDNEEEGKGEVTPEFERSVARRDSGLTGSSGREAASAEATQWRIMISQEWRRQLFTSFDFYTEHKGKLKKSRIAQIYRRYYTEGNPEKFSKYCHRMFDIDNKGFVSFGDYVDRMVTIKHGTFLQKNDLRFLLYDVDRDGRVSMQDMEKFLTSLYKLVGPVLAAGLEPPASRVERMFSNWKLAGTSHLYLEDFTFGSVSIWANDLAITFVNHLLDVVFKFFCNNADDLLQNDITKLN